MQPIVNIVVVWPKGFTGVASTYVSEFDGTSLWLGHLGKGGAYTNLEVKTLGVVAPDLNIAGRAVAAKIGNALGGKVIDKFRAEIDANLALYNQGGRGMLDGHKKTRTIPLSSISDVELTTKPGINTPPVLRGLPGPHLSCKLDGKTHIFFAIPSSAHDMTALARQLTG